MLVRTLNAYDLQQLMRSFNRDYFTFNGYEALIDLFNDENEVVEFDPVGISCEFTEDSPINVWEMYDHLFTDIPKPDVYSDNFEHWVWSFVYDVLNDYTWARLLDNGNIIFIIKQINKCFITIKCEIVTIE